MTATMEPLVDTLIEDARWNSAGIEDLAETAARAVMEAHGLPPEGYEISLLACDDRRIAALNDFLPGRQLAKLMEEKRIEIAPLAFMRGRTLSNAFVVLDEAQNATTMQMKMFLTRLGEGSRMVITGDRSQVDLPRGVQSGLRDAENLLSAVDGISFSYFTAKDVVRHPLVARIIEAYDAADAQTG